ncbi:phytanoyl-CoA dioxygenase [Patellaria atrata CBS 101060]|uniref:Phytanoyl-CoA dioxygenase n=1 Tax=Patellaria atrata CBS 101060 TaxID=1346257 RepID=A0A9P4VQA9_9PEZI|nr:phytanoyl-CoA dioxygenase [Patellaria atrata CBS 101060]
MFTEAYTNGTKPPSFADTLSRDGYVLIPSVLSQSELTALRSACNEATALARAGKWPYIRTLPKQFPPWPSDPSSGIWGVQHLMHPSMPNSALFTKSYFMDKITEPVKEIIGCEQEDLVMELYNLLVRPDKDFELKWHRDDIPAMATPEEELERLNKPAWHAQWNLALYDDKSLIAVPGSHRRARTDAERNADPFERSLEGQRPVEMRAGDVVFYNNNILHRGVYDHDVERMTLHGSMGHRKANKERARNVLQHGVGIWVDQCDFSTLDGHLQEKAEAMRKRLVELGTVSGDVGFFAENE